MVNGLVNAARDMRVTSLTRLLPGPALALSVALLATGGETMLDRIGILRLPATVLALIIGMAMNPFARGTARVGPGITYAVKKLLRIAIALLGLRIAVSDIVGLGLGTAIIVVTLMAVTLASGFGLARVFGRSAIYGALAGGATAVCGASAALAIATVLPQGRETEADTAFTVLVCNALATIAMLALPPVALWLGFDQRLAGIFLGATIHDVAQVVGAGYALSDTAGNVATIVKLLRVLMLLPVVLGIGLLFATSGGGAARARVPVPVFALVFLALAAVNSFGLAPAPVKDSLLFLSRWGLLIAIAALGLNTSVQAMIKLGWRHIAVIALVSLLLIVLAAVLLLVFRP